MWSRLARNGWSGYVAALVGPALATGTLKLFGAQINSTTVALLLLLIVLVIASRFGSRPAIVASLVCVLSLNFFFLPPLGTFKIRGTDNWITFFAFLITALTAGQLSSRAKRRAEEAESAKREIERLYYQLQDSFERSSQAKALKQSERLKSALLDAVTHDLRTPLTSIKASATTLLGDLRASKRHAAESRLDYDGRMEMLQVIEEEVDRLDRFIDGLTKLARIDAGELHLQPKWSAVDEIVVAAVKRAEPRTRAHRVEVWFEDELPSIKVDEHAISEAIYTLIHNAAKYSPPDSTIRIRARLDAQNILITVEDYGPGIRPEVRSRVFEKFFRAMRDGDVSEPKSPGTGMGLAIARGIIDAHGGKIWIEDPEGHSGSTFIVELPIGDHENQEEAKI